MSNFQSILITVNGSRIKEMASRKMVLLQTVAAKLAEQMEDLRRGHLNADDRQLIREKKDFELLKIDDSVNFCQVLIDFIPNEKEYELSARELNFLRNDKIISYE